ncbi:MAG: choice-of-anchor J domain-containing protein, partial [bacterium]|nr:choice-of-anchor J domain-containing protein [bacterium]
FINYDCSGGTAEDWLITPQIAIQANDTIYFWMDTYDFGFAPDDTYLKISTTDNQPASFTTTLWHIWEGGGYVNGWAQYAVDLSAYAGQSVYLAFQHTDVCGDGIFIDDVSVGHEYIPTAHDVTVASIDSPATIATPSVAFTPTATIQNPGLSPESDFKVFFQINDSLGAEVYLDSAQITSPDSILTDSFRQFAFTGFIPAAYSKYTAVAWTGLADDYSWNDTLSKPFRTWDLDVSTTSILNPLGSANPDPDLIPRVLFHNAGTQTADFDATFQATYGGSLMYNATLSITGLAGGADTTVEFPVWPGVRLEGTYNVTAYAAMNHDLNNANDTISGAFTSGYSIWQTWTSLPITTTGSAEVGYQGKLYTFGGYNGSNPISQISIYDTATASWSTSSVTLSSACDWPSAVAAQGKIFVMGGYDNSGIMLFNLDCYSPDGDSLNPRAAMPSAGAAFAAGVWRDSIIYRFGGYDASFNHMATVELYDIVSGTWTTSLTPLPDALSWGCAAIFGDTIVYSTGGNSSGSSAATYIGIINPSHPDSITWTTGTDYPGGATFAAAGGRVNIGGHHELMIAGGDNGFGPTGATYSYSTGGGWTQWADKTTPTMYVGGSQVGEYFVVAGGYDGGSFLTCNEALYLGSSASAQPVITATSPADGGIDIGVTSPVVITFSKTMDTTTVTYSCIPDPGNLIAAWNYDYTIMTVSHDSFAYSTNYSFMVTAGQSLDGYALKAGSVPDSFSFGTGVSGVNGQPASAGVAFFLSSAAPNPVRNGQTAIVFGLPQSGQVKIEVYNIAGQRVKTLVNGNMGAGYHSVTWNGRNEAGQKAANGVYMYRMNSGSFTATKKLLLVK